MEKATFAAGCFWGVEAAFKILPGVVSTTVGYTGGNKDNPTYEEVCTGTTGHAEACEVVFDPKLVSYEDLLALFWNIHDPTQVNRQGNDVGAQYRSAIFFHTQEQENLAKKAKEELVASGAPIATEIIHSVKFWEAEDYHQDYLDKNPGGYCHVDLRSVELWL
ncbi:MAG: peptide-methionine (S)-S-oxide reductase MsrA, partial [Candidatus Thermoplasmatota archaeon]|nr:peptide-methionine (S)-S-oxide reductase MsrA [Candidatus Thermoplasmatota archaeon]